MFEYMTAQEAAEGVMNINRVWLIPKNAEKPADARKKLMKN